MSIVRIIHNRENPYVTLNKAALWNQNLSLKATGLWARCLSRPDDWSFNVIEMARNMKEGRRAIYGAIDELIKEGYAIRLEHYEKNNIGKFIGGGVEYIFFEFKPTEEEKQKHIEEFKKSFRQCGFGNCHYGDSRNSTLLSNECTNPPNPPISEPCINSNTKDKSPLPPSGGEEARLKPDEFGDGIEISKKSFEESKKALREIKIEVDNEEKFIHPRMIDKLAKELTVEEIKNAEDYVAYCLEDPEFEIENLMGFLIHALREKKSPPDSNAIVNIEYARQRKKDWNLRSLSIYQDYVYECESCKELSNSMIPRAFREAFDRTFGPKADALAGGSSWGV